MDVEPPPPVYDIDKDGNKVLRKIPPPPRYYFEDLLEQLRHRFGHSWSDLTKMNIVSFHHLVKYYKHCMEVEQFKAAQRR